MTRRTIPVIHDVNLLFQSGEITALVGRNGAGKSTLLDALAGILPLAGGQVLLDGQDLHGLTRQQSARRLASLGQLERPDDELTAVEVALMGRSPHLGPWGLPSQGDRELAELALTRTQVLELAARPMATLSGGERQRVLLARALCQAGDALLLDEPTSSLDPGHALTVMRELRAEAERGCAVVVAVHDLALAARCADRVVVLNRGGVLSDGPWRSALTPAVLTEAFGVPMELVEVRGQPVVLSV